MTRFVKTTFAAALVSLAATAYAAGTSTPNTTTSTTSNNTRPMTPEEKTRIEEIVHQYLIQKPEVIVEALQILQKKQFEQAEQTVKKTQEAASQFADPLFHQASDPIAGNPNGKITIVEFFDYQCPHCVDMVPIIDTVVKSNPEVRVVYKEFPIRGPISDYAARAALAANKQGKYKELSHAILTSTQPLTQDSILAAAKNVGLDVDKLKKDMTDKSIDDQLKTNTKLGQDLKLLGTPAFFIGKTNATVKDSINYIPGQMSQSQLQDMIIKASK